LTYLSLNITQEEDYTYFFNGVKHVLKAKNDNLQGIHGAVAEVGKNVALPRPFCFKNCIAWRPSFSLSTMICCNEAPNGRGLYLFL
jgi:hypothetical protein